MEADRSMHASGRPEEDAVGWKVAQWLDGEGRCSWWRCVWRGGTRGCQEYYFSFLSIILSVSVSKQSWELGKNVALN